MTEIRNSKLRNVFEEAVATFGPESQIKMLHEEMAELVVAINKYERGLGNVDAIAEEIADVGIMLEQMEIVFGCRNLAAAWRIKKIDRLREKIDNEQTKPR